MYICLKLFVAPPQVVSAPSGGAKFDIYLETAEQSRI